MTSEPSKGSVPVPDPTLLTTQQLIRELQALRELLETRLTSVEYASTLIREIVETRLDGMDKAIKILQDIADKFPGRMDEKIMALSDVHEEKFESVQTQFSERDVRIEQAAGAVKIAVDAALQAQKEAASEANKSNAAATQKSETSTTKLIDAQAALIANLQKAFDDKITDVKERLTLIQGSAQGGKALWGYIAGAIGVAAILFEVLAKSGGASPIQVVLPQQAPSITTQPTR